MRPLFGPRTVVEAAFLVAVPVIALEVGFGWPAIIGSGAGAYLLVLAVEGAVRREGRRRKAPAAVAPAAAQVESPVPDAAHVRVIRTDQPVHAIAAPEPEPPRLVPVPTPAPEPEPELPPAATVVSITSSPGPRRWNLWDLERLAREQAGGDQVADEERTYLLLYLRDFAGPDGQLPLDFDDLVRQSFGGLVANL